MDTGKRHLHAGKVDKAEACFMQALALVVDYDSPYRNKRGIVAHRLADISIRKNEIERARWLFKKAASEITTDPMGRAICLRDFANFELLQGNPKLARKLLLEAAEETTRAESTFKKKRPERHEAERQTVSGFVARVDLVEGQYDRAIKRFREVAAHLRQYEERPAYELANLTWFIDALPPGEERDKHIARAKELSNELRNLYKQGEFFALGFGQPVRGLYRLTTAVTSFGLNRLKGVVNKIR